MTTTITPAPEIIDTTATDTIAAAADAEAVAERLIADVTTVFETLSTELGLRLGLFAALDQLGPSTPARLAARAGLDARMVREWCEQQTVAGMLTCVAPQAAPTDREFVLPDAVRSVLLDRTGDAWVAPLVELVPGITGVLDHVADTFRLGGGVPFHAYGAPMRHGLGDLNGAAFEAALPTWLDDVPAARELLAHPDARLLDLGCGTGRSSVAIALAHPHLHVLGVDLDAASITEARAHAEAAGVTDRVSFTVADAATIELDPGSFDVVTILEALHDMGNPLGALHTVQAALAPHGVCYLVDERVADVFGADVEMVERLQYGFSVLHCLPATLAEDPIEAHGTILRAPTVEDWATQAGFAVQPLDVEDPFWQHYALHA